MEKPKNDDLYYASRDGRGRPILGLVFILVGGAFLLMYTGVLNPATVGEFFGNFGASMGEFFGTLGSSIGEFFGNFGRTIGESFGNLGAVIGRLWPLLLIAVGLALLFVRRKPAIK